MVFMNKFMNYLLTDVEKDTIELIDELPTDIMKDTLVLRIWIGEKESGDKLSGNTLWWGN